MSDWSWREWLHNKFVLQADLIMVGLQYQIKTNSNDNRTVHKPFMP